MPKFAGCLMAALLTSALAIPANAAEPPKKNAGTAHAAPVVHAAPHVAAPHFARVAAAACRISPDTPVERRISRHVAAAHRISRATSRHRM